MNGRPSMEPVLELLNKLAHKGIKLSVEGDDLNCYAEKGLLTQGLKDSISQNKSQIMTILRIRDSLQPAENRTEKVPLLDLQAEAVLDPGIQTSGTGGDKVDFTAARAIFLTGASGFLGAFLLHDLLTDTDACIYCLVRCRSEADGYERIRNNLLGYGLWNDSFAPRILPLPGDLSRSLLGLGSTAFASLAGTIDTVYHNGAIVNFIYPYSSLKDSNVRGTEEVIRLACQGTPKPLHYVSTVGIFPSTRSHNTTILESDPAADWQGLVEGYRQSKWVAEKIVNIAAARGLPVRIYRPGFVSGDTASGIWNTDDFLPRMLKGCIQLRSVPDSDAQIQIVPVDYVSKAIVHLSRQRTLSSNVFHIVSPRTLPTRDLARLIASLGYNVTIVPYAEWRNALLEDARVSSGNVLYPLLTMFTDDPLLEQVPAFDCCNTLEGLKGTNIVCPEMNADLMAKYLAHFRNSGFLGA